MNEVVERRLEFLKLEAKGFSLCEIVKLLSEKYQTSERNIYCDAETRDTWQHVLTQLLDLDKALLIVDIADRLIALLSLETIREKQKAEKRAASVENVLAKSEPILESMSVFR